MEDEAVRVPVSLVINALTDWQVLKSEASNTIEYHREELNRNPFNVASPNILTLKNREESNKYSSCTKEF